MAHTPPATATQLPLRSFLGYGAGDMANNLTFRLVITFLALYYTDVLVVRESTGPRPHGAH
ncbi:MAG TPA: hypothetical protein H9815_19010 [Candidatus Ruania gallistercoris]|uniref:MFS transporter n=1 Tax=Candidatus Ruania gallistercoris TaxID=2838746 RepID=A0A9D2EI08_9MICO|nr:hypothetical protein [Candidatus Ruania gallistercoris]